MKWLPLRMEQLDIWFMIEPLRMSQHGTALNDQVAKSEGISNSMNAEPG